MVTKFTGQKIKQIAGPKKKRLWLTLLNESYFEKQKISKHEHIGYLVVEPETLKIQYEKAEKTKDKKKNPKNYLPKYWEMK